MLRNNKFSTKSDRDRINILFNENNIGVYLSLQCDGYYHVFFEEGGGFDSWVMREIAEIMDDVNKDIINHQEEYFKSNMMNNSDDNTDTPF